MADYATKDEVQLIVNKAVDDLSEIIQSFAQNVDNRFNTVEEDIADLKSDVAELKGDVAELKSDVANLNSKYDHLLQTLDAFLKRLDDNEIDNKARDAQVARLERWIEQIATQTGVKLEY